VKACYLVFSLVFGQTLASFPSEWYLQVLCFAAPIIGLGAIADSVVRLGFFVFTSKRKLPEWHRMNALAMRNHIVLCGVGKVGYRILEELLELGEDVVAIDRNGESPFVIEMTERGVTMLIGQARSRRTLEEANVKNARAFIVATDDDLANIDAALTAREINPDIRVVIRLFDDTLASKVAHSFHLPAIATARSAASSFIGAATDRQLYQSFMLGGQKFNVAGVKLSPTSPLIGRTVQSVEEELAVKIALLCRSDGTPAIAPELSTTLAGGMQLVAVAPVAAVVKLEKLGC